MINYDATYNHNPSKTDETNQNIMSTPVPTSSIDVVFILSMNIFMDYIEIFHFGFLVVCWMNSCIIEQNTCNLNYGKCLDTV